MVEDHQAAPASVERENSLYLSRCLTHRVASRTSSIAANRQELVISAMHFQIGHVRWDAMGEMDRDGVTETPERPTKGSGKISRKLLAGMIVAILLGASGVFVWYEYFRHWNVKDLEDAVNVISEMGPIIEGFDTDLAGRTVTVDAKIRMVQTLQTNMGQLSIMYLEGGMYASLMQWGSIDLEAGDRIEADVSFEWATINGAEGVYSPQAWIGKGRIATFQIIMQETSWVNDEWVTTPQDQGEDVLVTIERGSEPVPLSMANCTIRAGTRIDSMDYLDLMGFYRNTPNLDTITNLSDPPALNCTLEFSDVDDDGYLDDGDTFTLHNLIHPETECSVQTYLLMADRDLYPEEEGQDWERPRVFCTYIIMTDEGVILVNDPQIVHTTSVQSNCEGGVAITVDYISDPVGWDDVTILISDGADSVDLQVDQTALSTGSTSNYSCGVTKIGEYSMECVVIDAAGDGILGICDRIEILVRDDTRPEDIEYLWVVCIYEPADTAMLQEVFLFGAIPRSECAFTADGQSIILTFNPVHNGTGYDYELMDVLWNDVRVLISYEEYQIEWNPDGYLLGTGEPSTWISEGTQLGNMTLICVVGDLQGNGLVNAGDTIEVIVTLGDGFIPDIEYTLSIDYIPTDSDMYSAVFTG